LGAIACKRAALEVAGVLFATADDFLENRPEGIPCDSDFSENTLNAQGELTFSQNHLLCVNVKLDSLDFETMRYESRFGPSVRHKNGATVIAVFFEHFRQCDVPWPSEFNWYKGSIEVDGQVVQQVGLRKKGFLGSIFSPAPSMRIQTDRYISGQTLGTSTSITLNNNSEDPTRIRSSLNFLIFEKAGYPAPRCNLANVSINGEAFGAYSHLEAVDETFLQRAFGTASGHLYEGQLADFEEEWLPRWDAKTELTDPLAGPVLDLAVALDASDNVLLDKLEKYLNIDQFITFWAMEYLLDHTDGYSVGRNNFFVYFNPMDQNRAHFIPWGINYFEPVTGKDSITLESFVKAQIPRRLSRHTEIADKFEQEVLCLLDEVWNEDELLQLVDQLGQQVALTQDNPNYEDELEELREWIVGRRSAVMQAIDEGLPEGAEKAARRCFL